MGKILRKVLIVIFSAVFIFSAGMIAKNFYEAKKSEKVFTEISGLVKEEKESETAKALSAQEIYADLYARNSDFKGWIKIDGTNIDYPVMQSKDRPDYYLRRNFDKEYSYYGIPYIAEACDVDISQNTVIYGHNMLNGTLFSALENYKSKSFFESHQTFRFDTMSGFGTYQIICVFMSDINDDFPYHQFINAYNEDDFNSFIAECKKRQLYDTGVDIAYTDKLVTLSTCEYTRDGGRLIVVAKKVTS